MGDDQLVGENPLKRCRTNYCQQKCGYEKLILGDERIVTINNDKVYKIIKLVVEVTPIL